MPAPKYVERGRTVQGIRASVLLHPKLHALASKKAGKIGKSLSDYMGGLVAADLQWKASSG